MSLNPPPPFDPCTEADYAGWSEMINSIVGFVTASTQLASSLRNSRCCFPDTAKITEVVGDGKKDPKIEEVFNITDFPWFLDQLITISIDKVAEKASTSVYNVKTEPAPLIQFPLYDIPGEPSREPRTITLMDTKDFGDIDSSSSRAISQNSSFFIASIKRPLPKPEASNDSCFFKEYSDSEQTIDSSNLQEKFEGEEADEKCSAVRSEEVQPTIITNNGIGNQPAVQNKLDCSVEEAVCGHIRQAGTEKDVTDIQDEFHKVASSSNDEDRNTSNLRKVSLENTNKTTIFHRSNKENEAGKDAEPFQENEVLIFTPYEHRDIRKRDRLGLDDEENGTTTVKKSKTQSEEEMYTVLYKLGDKKNSSYKQIMETTSACTNNGKVIPVREAVKKLNAPSSNRATSSGIKGPSKVTKTRNQKETKNPGKPKTNSRPANTAKIEPQKRIIRGTDPVDFVTKNIVNCINIANKVKNNASNKMKNKTSQQKCKPNSKADLFKIDNRAPKSSIVAGNREDRKFSSIDTIRTSMPSKNLQKLRGVCINATLKTTSDKPSSTSKCINNVLKVLHNGPEYKSCLRPANKRIAFPPKQCVISSVIAEEPRRPYTADRVQNVIPKLPIDQAVTLKLSAAETVRRAAELLKQAEDRQIFSPDSQTKFRMRSRSAGSKRR